MRVVSGVCVVCACGVYGVYGVHTYTCLYVRAHHALTHVVIPRDENLAMLSSKLIPPTPITSIMSAGLLRVLKQALATAIRTYILYCTVPYCTVLYCTVLYCTVLYCTVLYCTVLYCTVLYCTVLYCT